jgi:N-sulfoglucosamine sulfohydrolase
VDGLAAGMQPITGRSLTNLFLSEREGRVDPARDFVLIGKERHDVGRPQDQGYPIRGIVRDGFLYVHNFETDRWPSGNPETGYLNCDGSPTKTICIQARRNPALRHYWEMSLGKRTAEELYDVTSDPACIRNLADAPEHAQRKEALRDQLFAELREQGDPRMFGQGDVFDRYVYAHESNRNFYERFMRGERPPTCWVNDTDFDP